MKTLAKSFLALAMMFVLTGALAAIAGCEKREYNRHEEKVQKDVVVQEGPIVE
jgi:hypothetical protein